MGGRCLEHQEKGEEVKFLKCWLIEFGIIAGVALLALAVWWANL